MDSNLLARFVRLEALAEERQEQFRLHIEELKQTDIELEKQFTELLKKHTEEELRLITDLLNSVKTIETQTARYKGILGGVVLTVSALWFVLAQIFSWIHLDFIKLVSTVLGK